MCSTLKNRALLEQTENPIAMGLKQELQEIPQHETLGAGAN